VGAKLLRIQDADGRGPYKPGMQSQWADAAHDQRNPAIFDEFGWKVCKSIRADEYAGCAFIDAEQLRRWFSRRELGEIEKLGYQLVEIEASRIVGRSKHQLVFISKLPLSKAAKELPWTVASEQA
jgi:hypothetical protein